MDDIDQEIWPPPDAHEKRGEIAWRRVLKRVKDHLMEVKRQFKASIRKAGSDALILQIQNGQTDDDPYKILMGLMRENKPSRKPFFVSKEHAIELINTLDDTDRVQIARILFWTYVYDVMDHREEEDEDGQDEDPEDEAYAWNGGVAPSFSMFEPERDPADLLCNGDERDHSPETLGFIHMHPELRELYYRIVSGEL